MNVIGTIIQNFINKYKNAVGIDRDLIQLLQDNDVEKAKQIFQNRDIEVERAISEYDPELHKIMFRPNKHRKGKDPYETVKNPQPWQRFINEISLYFLLAKPIIWREIDPTDETKEAFAVFEEFLKDVRFNTTMRDAKRKAGALTECAKVYHLYQEAKGDSISAKVKAIVISKDNGYTLRPLFDQYNNMLAFGYGYFLKENGKSVEHFDILTDDVNYYCRKSGGMWSVEAVNNPVGKICAIYYNQPCEWDGVQKLIERIESLDSKTGDANNYFADPILTATVDVVKSMPDQDAAGKLLQLGGADSKVEYLDPPQASELRTEERANLRDLILSFSSTPDYSYQGLKGSGTLSGEAMRQALILGYMKRDNRMEIYDELVDREKNLILAIIAKVTHIRLREVIAKLNIEHEFADPIDKDTQAEWTAIGRAYDVGIISLETAVNLMGVADPIVEVERIKAEKQNVEEQIQYPIAN